MIQTHTLTYRNWSAIMHDLELTQKEREEAEAFLEHHATWGDAAYTLIEPEIAVDALEHTFRAFNPEGPDTEELVRLAVDAVGGHAVNLEM
jgi:hypothetical protein